MTQPEQQRQLRTKRALFVLAIAAGALFGLLFGILIGRASEDTAATPATTSGSGVALAQLTVTSKPVDANVLVDGRFVGVSPVARIDLDPGKHSVVIDAFGYQPYAGTLEVEPAGRASLKVVLAPMGGSGTTNGELVAEGKHKNSATNVVVPPTALAPVSLTGTGVSKEGAKPKAAGGSRGGGGGGGYASSYSPPSRPRRDCSGEKSQCRDGCYRAGTDCDFSCPGCSSCSTSVGWDECNRQCKQCRQNCESNKKFCESTCDTSYNTCVSSNN